MPTGTININQLNISQMTKVIKALELNFNTVENAVKTVGTIVIAIAGILLTINSFMNPVNFTF